MAEVSYGSDHVLKFGEDLGDFGVTEYGGYGGRGLEASCRGDMNRIEGAPADGTDKQELAKQYAPFTSE